MPSHADIITRNAPDARTADLLGVKLHQVRDWRLRNSIPAEHWKALSEAGLATLAELAEGAAARSTRAA